MKSRIISTAISATIKCSPHARYRKGKCRGQTTAYRVINPLDSFSHKGTKEDTKATKKKNFLFVSFVSSFVPLCEIVLEHRRTPAAFVEDVLHVTRSAIWFAILDVTRGAGRLWCRAIEWLE